MLVASIIAVALEVGAVQASQEAIEGYATHYGRSYQGRTMGCGGTYDSDNPQILAVGPSRYAEWPCGHRLVISGPAGSLELRRTDSCPGCAPNVVDLSEAGVRIVCGGEFTCKVNIRAE